MRYLGFVSTPSENPSPDLFQTGRLKPVHELDLDGRGHWLLFILKAVARADIDQFDAGRDVHFGFL